MVKLRPNYRTCPIDQQQTISQHAQQEARRQIQQPIAYAIMPYTTSCDHVRHQHLYMITEAYRVYHAIIRCDTWHDIPSIIMAPISHQVPRFIQNFYGLQTQHAQQRRPDTSVKSTPCMNTGMNTRMRLPRKCIHSRIGMHAFTHTSTHAYTHMLTHMHTYTYASTQHTPAIIRRRIQENPGQCQCVRRALPCLSARIFLFCVWDQCVRIWGLGFGVEGLGFRA